MRILPNEFLEEAAPTVHPARLQALAITLPIPNSVVVAFKLRMPEQCAERQRLGRKVAEAVSAVYALKDRENATKGKKDAALSLQLDQARTAQRMTEHALRDHIHEHGCMVEKT